MSSPLSYPNHSSNHSLETKRGDIRHYLSPNKSTLIKISTQEVNQSIESTESQKSIFHLNKTKTIIKSLNLENNLNGFTSNNSNNSIVVYRLSSAKDLIKKSVPNCSQQSSQSSETNSHKKRYLVSQKSGKVYEIVGNRSAVKREATEPDTDLITDEEYFQYLNLIGSKRLKSEHKSSLNQWPLRSLSKVESTPVYDSNGHILLTDVCPKPSCESNTTEDKSEVSRRKLAKSQWLTEVKDSSNRLDDQIDRFRDESTRKREKLMKEWQTNALNTISFFGLSSLMGMRLFRSLYSPMNKVQTYVKICDFEQFCLDSVLNNLLTSNYFYGFNGVSRITRSRDSNDWNPRYYQHKYCFTRIQRLEKWKQLETGLNWRSRLLKSQCKRAFIKIHKIKWCPICTKDIEFEYRHQCYEYEPHLRPTNSRNASKVCDSSNEIIIGDDFFNEDLAQNNDIFENSNNFNQQMVEVIKEEVREEIKDMEVITADEEEDDDIMIVEEVFKTKDRNIVLKTLLTTNATQKTADSSKKPSIMSFSQKTNISRSPSDQRGCQTLLSLLTSDSNPESNRFKQNDFVFASHSSKNS